MKIQIITTVILLSLLSCKSNKNELDRVKDGFTGDVIFCKTESKNSSEYNFYNDSGMLTRQVTLNQDAKSYILKEDLVEYRNLKRVKKSGNIYYLQQDPYSLNTFNSIATYKYNREGMIDEVEINGYLECKIKFTYNSKGNLIEEKHSYTKSDKVKTIKINHYYGFWNLDSTIDEEVSKNGTINLKKSFYIDGKETQISFFSNSNIRQMNKMSYDKNGMLESVIKTFYSDNNTNKIEHIDTFKNAYTYDPIGNWIENTVFKNGKEQLSFKRYIVYKGGNYKDSTGELEKAIAGLLTAKSLIADKEKNVENVPQSNSTNIIVTPSNNQTYQPVQKQWVNCERCHGRGIRECERCYGKGTERCGTCGGTGIYSNHVCGSCQGTRVTNCGLCWGKGNRGKCLSCNGRGQVLL